MAKKTHASRSDLQATEIPGLLEQRSTAWEGYPVSFTTVKKEQDPSPLFTGHWGYVFKPTFIPQYKGFQSPTIEPSLQEIMKRTIDFFDSNVGKE